MDKPPHSDNLSERVRSEMEEAFLSGALVPGQVLDERSLAERFGVSRTPVREAVQSLASSGLLKVVSRVGIVVPKLTIKDLLALLEILAELEGICASFAARRMSAKERQLLREAMTACETAADKGDVAAYESANRAFHAAIYAGARNEWAAAQFAPCVSVPRNISAQGLSWLAARSIRWAGTTRSWRRSSRAKAKRPDGPCLNTCRQAAATSRSLSARLSRICSRASKRPPNPCVGPSSAPRVIATRRGSGGSARRRRRSKRH